MGKEKRFFYPPEVVSFNGRNFTWILVKNSFCLVVGLFYSLLIHCKNFEVEKAIWYSKDNFPSV